MKNTIKNKFNILILIIIIAIIATVLSACSTGVDDDSERRAAGYKCVTFDSNGGKIGNHEKRTVYVKPGEPIPTPGTLYQSSLPSPVYKDDHDMMGWFSGSLNEDNLVLDDEEWSFSKNMMPDEDITLYAKWIPKLSCVAKYGPNNDFSLEFPIKYISHFSAESERYVDYPTKAPPILEGHTFIDYYLDSELKTPFVDRIPHNGNIENNVLTVYARFIEGTYKIVRTPNDLSNFSPVQNLYLLNDIDMTGVNFNMQNYSGTIKGNGFTVKNITVEEIQLGSNIKYGLFKSLNGAKIENINFENINITVLFKNMGSGSFFGLLCGDIRNQTIIENVKISGKITALVRIPYNNITLRADESDLLGVIPPGFNFDTLDSNIESILLYSYTPNPEFSDSDLRAEGFVKVILDGAGGYIGDDGEETVYCYMKKDAPISFIEKVINLGETFDGWYLGEKIGDQINYIEEWDIDRVLDNDITLYAKWR